MTDRPDPPDSSASNADSPEIAEVRRLLAESRHTEPMPDDVAARLDDVLLDLSAQRSRETESARPTVVPIPAHRRRRAAGLLVAAAAIVVGGVVLAPNIHLTSAGNSSATSAEDASGSKNLDRLDHPPNARAEGQSTPEPSQDLGTPTSGEGPVVVHPRRFPVDALRARRQLARGQAYDAAKAACVDVPSRARAVRAEYRHAPAALVYRRPEGNSQVVELFLCGSKQPIRSTTLSAP